MKVYTTNKDRSKFNVFDGAKHYVVGDHSALGKNSFELFKGYTDTDEDRERFHRDFTRWSEELRTSLGFTFSFKDFWNSNKAITYLFSQLTRERPHAPMTQVETEWMDSSYRGGLIYNEDDQELHSADAYDFRAFYARLLGDSDLKIPKRSGVEKTYTSLPKRLRYGFYRVKVECHDAEVTKVFNFSPNNVYTHQVLTLARRLQATAFPSMRINIIADGKPNAFIYRSSYLTDTKSIFGTWFTVLSGIKKRYPDNKLVKNILSSTYGRLCRRYTKYVNADDEAAVAEIAAQPQFRYVKFQHYKDTFQYVYQNSTSAYNFRLVPFLTAMGRVTMAETILPHLGKVVRVATDGVVFREPVDIHIDDFRSDEAYCGHITVRKGHKPEKVSPTDGV